MSILKSFTLSLSLAVALSSCSEDASDERVPIASSADDLQVNPIDIAPANEPKLDEASWDEAVDSIELPSPIRIGTLAFHSQLAASFGLRSDSCNNVGPRVDQIAAAGPAATLTIVYDHSDCVKESFVKDGYKISASTVLAKGVVTLICPEANFDSLNGRSYKEIKASGDNKLLTCRYSGSEQIKFKSGLRMEVLIQGESKAATRILVSDKKLTATYGKGSSGYCLLQASGTKITYSDCIEGGKITSRSQSDDEALKDIQLAYRISMDGMTAGRDSDYFSDPKARPFEVNNWTGTLQFTSRSEGQYDMTNGRVRKTGSIYP